MLIKERKIENHYPAKVGDVCLAQVNETTMIMGEVLQVRGDIVTKLRSSDGVYFVDNFQKLVDRRTDFKAGYDSCFGRYSSLESALLALGKYRKAGR